MPHACATRQVYEEARKTMGRPGVFLSVIVSIRWHGIAAQLVAEVVNALPWCIHLVDIVSTWDHHEGDMKEH